ncbi:MAG: hypothetical protein IKG47_03420 [Oscillospiraceae bacterium]|nr:hypothetical protein [Oscillospiraceae bacterium]
MKQTYKFQILDGTMLKIIAIISMVIDHVGDVFFPGAIWMRAVGRLAMPLFAFCVAEGYHYTKSKIKYLRRLGAFALISEIPFDLAFSRKIDFSHQNIMLSFLIAVAALMLYDAIQDGFGPFSGMKQRARKAAGITAVLVMSIVSLVLKCDYTIFAVISVFLFYVLRERPYPIPQVGGVVFLAVTRTMGYYAYTGLSLIPLLLYNGKRGRGLKWLFYVFYPAHMLLIYLIKLIVK